MTKAKQFETAWRQLCRGDFNLLDEITDPSFQAKSQGIILDLEAYKGIIKALTESIIIGPFRVIHEADEFLRLHRYSKFRNEEILMPLSLPFHTKIKKSFPKKVVEKN